MTPRSRSVGLSVLLLLAAALLPVGDTSATNPYCTLLDDYELTAEMKQAIARVVQDGKFVAGFLKDPEGSAGDVLGRPVVAESDADADLVTAIVAEIVDRVFVDRFDAMLQEPGVSGMGVGWEDGRFRLKVFCAWDLPGEDELPLCGDEKAAGKLREAFDPVLKLAFGEPESGKVLVRERYSGVIGALGANKVVPSGGGAGHPRVREGTIGSFVVDMVDPDFRYLLGCNHVFAATGHGIPFRDPAVLRPRGFNHQRVGTLWRYLPIEFDNFDDEAWNEVDAAIVRLDQSDTTIKAHNAWSLNEAPAKNVCIEDRVHKYGSKSSKTAGNVIALHAKFKVRYGPKVAYFEDQIVVRHEGHSRKDRKAFCKPGDSGSLVVTEPYEGAAQAVGLAFAGTSDYTLVNRIGPVLHGLGVKIDPGPGTQRIADSRVEEHTPVVGFESPKKVGRSSPVFEKPEVVDNQWDGVFSGVVGHNSNAAPLTDDEIETVVAGLMLEGDYRRRHYHDEQRSHGFDVGFSASGDWHDDSKRTAPLMANTRFDWTRDSTRFEDRKLAQISFGFGGDLGWVWSRGDPFERNSSLTGALMLTWDKHGHCELDNTVLFGSGVLRDDPWVDEDQMHLDRSGTLYSVGLEHTVFSDKFDPNLDCERAGPFRQILRSDSLTYFFGAEFVRFNSDGTEFGSDTYIARTGGELPLGRSRLSIDWYGELTRSDFFDPSDEAPGIRHEDDAGLLDVGLRWRITEEGDRTRRLSHLDLRLGVQQEWINSSVDLYDYARTAVTLGLDGRFFRQRLDGAAPPITESGGSRSRRRTTQSGTSSAQVPQQSN